MDEHNFSIFDDIALSLVYKTPIPNEQEIIELKQKLMENYNENSQADSYINGMNKEIIKYTWETPYATYSYLREELPLWFSENMAYIWDMSAMLNSEELKISLNEGEDYQTGIFEAIEWQYVSYLLEMKMPLRIINPYLVMMDDESIARTLSDLIEYDYDPSDIENWREYYSVYEKFINERDTDQLREGYEILKQKQGDFHIEQAQNHEFRDNVYKGLKHLSNMNSIKPFNDRVIEYLQGILNDSIQIESIIDENLPEYVDWQNISKPFHLLATYLELIQADNDTDRNKLLSSLFIDNIVEVPYAFKIFIIKKMSDILLHKHVNVSQDIILAMIIEFEKFESRSSLITGKYFGHVNINDQDKVFGEFVNSAEISVPKAERQLIRYSLNQGLSSGIMLG